MESKHEERIKPGLGSSVSDKEPDAQPTTIDDATAMASLKWY